MMRPINRIPMEIDSPPLHTIVHGELKNTFRAASLSAELQFQIDHTDEDSEHFECMMDWAMQIRSELGIDWQSAIRAASILFFG